MKTVLLYVISAIIGVAGILALNRSFLHEKVPGIGLPFGWQGPHYWVLTCTPVCPDYMGLPFAVRRMNTDRGDYWNNAALWLNAGTGVAVGLGAGVVLQRTLFHRREQ